MNSLISTPLFYQPKMQVSFGQVKTLTHMLYQYIQDKQFKNYISAEPLNWDINVASLNLGFKVKGQPMNKKDGDKAQIIMQEKNELQKHLSLAYYANQMSVYFKLESIIAHSINYFIEKRTSHP